VVKAVQEQAARLFFYSNAAHCAERVAASELLLKHAPRSESRVFYCCSGSEANETALKIARKATGRRKVVTFVNSFHGRTLGALAASGIPKYRATAGPVLPEGYVYLPLGDVDALHAAVDGDTAAIICEAIQSLGGVRMAQPEFYHLAAELARKRGAALIFDEVQTGFGRTGTYFFSEGVNVQPDMTTMAKGIASGLPVGAVIVAPEWASRVALGDQGSTFGGAPVCMAAMRATLEVIERERLAENAARVGELLVAGVRGQPRVKAVRGKGLLLGIEFNGPCQPIVRALIQRGIVTGSSSEPNVMRLLPPLVLTPAQAREFVDTLADIVANPMGAA
jgi:acetylornithine aminotransferase/acetylornithine/N-succinyldiaminopimelate aminotransferase